MKAFCFRVVYAAVGFIVFWLILPLFLNVIGLHPDGNLMQLLKIATACIALLYVLYPSNPPMPF